MEVSDELKYCEGLCDWCGAMEGSKHECPFTRLLKRVQRLEAQVALLLSRGDDGK